MARQPKQLKLPMGSGTAKQFPANRGVVNAASEYAKQIGGSFSTKGLDQLQTDATMAYSVGAAYNRAQGGSTDTPELRASYDAMRTHVGKQFDFLTRPKDAGGLGVNVEVTKEDPYEFGPKGFKQMGRDIKRGSFKVLATESTGGHAFFTNEENDQFRAVHDVFGHLSTGRGFSRHGEEATFQAHRQLFPPEAHAALASETRGQNSFATTFNPGQFPDQTEHLVGLPSWATGTDISAGAPAAPKKRTPKPKQGKLF